MDLRRQILVVRVVAWLLFLVAGIVIAGELRLSVFYFVPVVVSASWLADKRLPALLARRVFKRFAAETNRESFGAARRTLDELRAAYAGSSAALEQLRMHEGSLLCLEQHFSQAASLLASLDRRLLGARWDPFLLNNLGWALVMMGDAARAVAIARESIASSEKQGALAITTGDLRACQLGTLGAALALSGQEEEAVPLLEQALARGGTPRQQAARALYLGEAEKTRGKSTEAFAAYERAIKEGPDTTYGEKARERLASQKAYRS